MRDWKMQNVEYCYAEQHRDADQASTLNHSRSARLGTIVTSVIQRLQLMDVLHGLLTIVTH